MAGPLVRPRPYAREIALTAAVAALLWIAIAALLYQLRDNRLSAARADAAGLARVFAENTAHAIDAADQAMLVMRAVYLGDPAHFTFAAWNDSVRYSDGMIIQTAIIGPDGLVIQTNLGMIKGTMDLSDREHFRVQRDSTADFLFISKPVLGRASGRWTIQLTRRILGADGRFAGVFVVSLDPVILSRPFVAADIGHGSVVLAGIDGVIRAGAPDAVTLLGQTVAPASLLAATRASEQGTIAFRDPAGSPVIASFRAVGRYGLSITVMLNQDDVLAGYRRNRFNYIAGGAGLTTLLLIVGGSLVRHKRRLLDARGALLGSRALLAETLESITQGIMMIDEDLKIPVINRRALELLGLPASFMQVDPDFRELLTWQEAEGEFGAAGSAAADAARRMELDRLREGDDFYERVRPDGTIVEVRTTRLHGRRAVRTLTDVTERRRAEDRINYLSHHADHDVLTGLANRARFHERLNEAISIAKRVSTGFMVLFLDLDQFKQVNDTMGHAAGDQLLKLVAERLREAVRDTDTVARFGGDEFAVLQALVARPEVGAVLAQRLIRSLSAPYRIDERQAIVGVSIGLAVYPRDGREADDLLKSADIALYAAKKDGRGTCRFFEPEMDRRVLERTELARDLREAIAADGVVPHYQPICDAGSGQVLGYEALARWRHPIRGQVSPADFIPLAEETGLIVALGLNVLKTACRTAAGWSDGAYVTVNVSPMQLTVPGFELVVLGVLRESGLPPNRLRIEITEGVLMREGDGLPKALNLLRQHGVRILLDDFGTGHAGLSYLLRFPFDGIKVDRSFVSRIVDNAAAQAIIQATLVLSASLKLDVIAEGVETEEQRAALRLAGCRHVQGYLFGAPMPADAIPSAPAELAPSPTTGAPGPGPPESGALDPTSRAA